MPKDIPNTVDIYQFKNQHNHFMEAIPPRLLNPEITFITKEFAKL